MEELATLRGAPRRTAEGAASRRAPRCAASAHDRPRRTMQVGGLVVAAARALEQRKGERLSGALSVSGERVAIVIFYCAESQVLDPASREHPGTTCPERLYALPPASKKRMF